MSNNLSASSLPLRWIVLSCILLSNSAGYRALAQIHQAFHIDSVKGAEYLRQYYELTRGDMQCLGVTEYLSA